MTFHGTLFFQTVKFLGLRKTRLLFLLKQTLYEDIYNFLAATAGYVLSGVRRLRAPEQGNFVLWWGRIGWSTKYYSFLLEYCPHSGVIHPEKKWPAWSTKYCYFNWSTNLSPWQGVVDKQVATIKRPLLLSPQNTIIKLWLHALSLAGIFFIYALVW